MPSLSEIALVAGILVALFGQWRGWWESPTRREQRDRERVAAEQAREIHSAILGEPERHDLAGHLIDEGRPGLVALQRTDSRRLAKVEEAVVAMNHLTGLFTEAMKRMDGHDAHLTEHDAAIAALIAATFERGADTAMKTEEIKRQDVVDGEVT